MVENQNDKPSTYGKMISKRKRMVWGCDKNGVKHRRT
jgi:hypothetical protein